MNKALLISLLSACTFSPSLSVAVDGDAVTDGDPVPAGTFRTADIVIDHSLQLGVTAPTSQVAFISKSATTDTTQLWIQSTDTGHVGTGGNNEQIQFVGRNSTTFDTTSIGGHASVVDVVAAGAVSAGANALTNTGVFASASCDAVAQAWLLAGREPKVSTVARESFVEMARERELFVAKFPEMLVDVCNGGSAYSFNSPAGELRNDGTVNFNASARVELGSAVQSHVVLEANPTTDVSRISIGANPAVNGTAIQTKNTVPSASLTGVQVLLDTTVTAGVRGGFLMTRGAGGDAAGNSAGIVAAGDTTYPFVGSVAGELNVYSEWGQPIVFGADNVGFTKAFLLTPKNHLAFLNSAPTVGSNCTNGGSSVATQLTDDAGWITVGATSTACTVTFSNTKTVKPACVVTSEAGAALSYTVSATAITMGTVTAGATYHYWCPCVGSTCT